MNDRRLGTRLTDRAADLQPHVNAAFHAVNERAHATSREATLYGSIPAFWRARRHCEDMGALASFTSLTHSRQFPCVFLWRLRQLGTSKDESEKGIMQSLMYHTQTSIPLSYIYATFSFSVGALPLEFTSPLSQVLKAANATFPSGGRVRLFLCYSVCPQGRSF